MNAGMQTLVQNDGELSKHFEAAKESNRRIDAFQDSDIGFPTRYRFDSNLFNLREQTEY